MNRAMHIKKQLKWSQLMLKIIHVLTLVKKLMINFQLGDHVRLSKYKSSFAEEYTPYFSEEVFVIKEVKYIAPWTDFSNDLDGEEIIGTFHENEFQKANQKEFMIEKAVKKKRNMVYLKRKGYDN